MNHSTWVTRTQVNLTEWWGTLARFRFMLSPTGNGIQSPKTMEALAVQTIPIVQDTPAYRDLQRMGYPIVVVEKWDEITPEKLEVWWGQLSPILPLAAMMTTTGCWWAMLRVQGPLHICKALASCAGVTLDSCMAKSTVKEGLVVLPLAPAPSSWLPSPGIDSDAEAEFL